MPGSRFELRLDVKPWMSVLLCILLLTLPVTWLAAWLVSVAVHELGHLLMLRILSIPVYAVIVGLGGIRIETAPMAPGQELLCALAGPMAGCLLVRFGRWFPLAAVFAFVHTAWNLLPIGNSDGARALRSLWAFVRKIPCKQTRERLQ